MTKSQTSTKLEKSYLNQNKQKTLRKYDDLMVNYLRSPEFGCVIKVNFLHLLRIKSSTNFSHAQWFVSWHFFSLWVLRWQIASIKKKLNAQVSNDIFDMWKWSIFDTCGFSFRINWSICLVAFFVLTLLFLLLSQNCYFWRQSELRWSWI